MFIVFNNPLNVSYINWWSPVGSPSSPPSRSSWRFFAHGCPSRAVRGCGNSSRSPCGAPNGWSNADGWSSGGGAVPIWCGAPVWWLCSPTAPRFARMEHHFNTYAVGRCWKVYSPTRVLLQAKCSWIVSDSSCLWGVLLGCSGASKVPCPLLLFHPCCQWF